MFEFFRSERLLRECGLAFPFLLVQLVHSGPQQRGHLGDFALHGHAALSRRCNQVSAKEKKRVRRVHRERPGRCPSRTLPGTRDTELAEGRGQRKIRRRNVGGRQGQEIRIGTCEGGVGQHQRAAVLRIDLLEKEVAGAAIAQSEKGEET